MNINILKERLDKYSPYSKSVHVVTQDLFKQINFIKNDYLKYSCIYLICSKLLEDNLISLKDYSKISGIEIYFLIKYEKELFNYIYRNNINLLKFTNI